MFKKLEWRESASGTFIAWTTFGNYIVRDRRWIFDIKPDGFCMCYSPEQHKSNKKQHKSTKKAMKAAQKDFKLRLRVGAGEFRFRESNTSSLNVYPNNSEQFNAEELLFKFMCWEHSDSLESGDADISDIQRDIKNYLAKNPPPPQKTLREVAGHNAFSMATVSPLRRKFKE